MRALLDVEDGKVDIMQIGSKAENHDEVPYTVDQLRAYDMVILVNVSNADLKAVAEAKGADNLEQFALNLKSMCPFTAAVFLPWAVTKEPK